MKTIDKILASKGQAVSVCFRSEVKPAASHKAHKLEKVVKTVSRAGVNFANISEVTEGIRKGERGKVQSLPWGQWENFPHIITHKGSRYVRLYPFGETKCRYYVDGVEVSKTDFAALLTPSASAKLLNKEIPQCFNVKAENIID